MHRDDRSEERAVRFAVEVVRFDELGRALDRRTGKKARP
jgi:hypothetical protein